MITKSQFLLFYAFFVAMTLFFEGFVYTWAVDNNVSMSTFDVKNISQSANKVNTDTNSTCFYDVTTLGGKDVYLGCDKTYWHNNELRSCSDFSYMCESVLPGGCTPVSPSCIINTFSSGSTFSGVAQPIVYFTSLGTNDANLSWFNLIILAPLTLIATWVVVTSLIPTTNSGA